MLNETDNSQVADLLAEFSRAQAKQHEKVDDILDKYHLLLEDHKRLISDYGEKHEGRERDRRIAKGQENSPFALVLIDRDGYVFDNDLVSNGAEGGAKAAQHLDSCVKDLLRQRCLDDCKVMVRVCADLAGLSRALHRSKLCGSHVRSIAPFVASFNRSGELFDYVDAGDLKENTDYKIRAVLRHFMDDPQCRHIFFAGCHDVAYLNELVPYREADDRITLVRHHALHPQFVRLGLRIEDFPNIFRLSSLNYATSASTAEVHKVLVPEPLSGTVNASATKGEQHFPRVCHFFQYGICKYGDDCHNLHISKPEDQGNNIASTYQVAAKARGSYENIPISAGPPNFEKELPHSKDVPHGYIAVDSSGSRLDTYLPPTSRQEVAEFQKRIERKKLCNQYHLNNACNHQACEFDHRPIDSATKTCLLQMLRRKPCPRRRGCRDAKCTNGHLCQRQDCCSYGGKTPCRFPPDLHYLGISVGSSALEAPPTFHDEDSLDTGDLITLTSDDEAAEG